VGTTHAKNGPGNGPRDGRRRSAWRSRRARPFRTLALLVPTTLLLGLLLAPPPAAGQVIDPDFRLSFTYGSYVTLTNLGPKGFQRLIDQRPLTTAVSRCPVRPPAGLEYQVHRRHRRNLALGLRQVDPSSEVVGVAVGDDRFGLDWTIVGFDPGYPVPLAAQTPRRALVFDDHPEVSGQAHQATNDRLYAALNAEPADPHLHVGDAVEGGGGAADVGRVDGSWSSVEGIRDRAGTAAPAPRAAMAI